MEKDIMNWIEISDRDEVVRFLKSLWSEKPQPCPICGGELGFLHKKAKKSNCDWICTVCNQRYDTIKILKQLNDE
jgi:hypothetical protein